MDEVCTQVLDSARWLAGVMKYPGDPGYHKWVAQYDSAVIFGGEENPGGPGDLAQYLTLPKAQLAVAPVSDICNSVREGGKERFDGIAKSLTESTVSDAGQALKDSVVKGRLEVEDGEENPSLGGVLKGFKIMHEDAEILVNDYMGHALERKSEGFSGSSGSLQR